MEKISDENLFNFILNTTRALTKLRSSELALRQILQELQANPSPDIQKISAKYPAYCEHFFREQMIVLENQEPALAAYLSDEDQSSGVRIPPPESAE